MPEANEVVAHVEANEANPAATPENVAAPVSDTQAEPDVITEAEAKKFTQEELNAIVQKEKAKAEAKADRRALKAYRETMERFAPAPQQQPQQADAAPSREQFANDEAWLDARDEWRDAKRDREAQQQRQQQQHQSISSKTETIYAEAQKIAGFDREAFDELPLTAAIAGAVIESDVAAKLMHHMANHPEEVERIAGLSPARQAAEIGKLELAIAAVPKLSNAPPPIKPIGNNGRSSKDPSEMTDKEFANWRAAQIAQRR